MMQMLSRCLPVILSFLATTARFSSAAAAADGRMPVIVNQAADGVVNYVSQQLEKCGAPLGKGATKEMAFGALDQEVDQYQGTGVTHIFWNVNYQRVGYRSDVWPSYWDVDGAETNVTTWPRSYYELHKLGIDDVFERLIPRSRKRGISPWVSLRMNDHHYGNNPTQVSPLFFGHPELRIHGGKGLFNYAKPEVREHYLKLATEVLQRYDIDGIELDWIRTPNNFEDGELDLGRSILTDFVRDVRKQTQAAAKRLGHSVRLAVRVPATPEFAFGKGFDAAMWAREGLVDMIIPSDWWDGCADTPVEAWRAQIGPAGRDCQIVPCTAGTYACTKKGYKMSHNLASMRGFTVQTLDRGADGIYLFNHFHAVSSGVRVRMPDGSMTNECLLADIFRAAGDLPSALVITRVHPLGIHDCLPDKTDYRPALPAIIETQEPHTFKIHTGPKPATGRYVVRIGLDKSDDLAAAKLGVKLNGGDCRAFDDLPVPAKPDPRPEQPRMNTCEVAPRVLQFEAPLESVVRGYNTVELTMLKGRPQTIIWLDVVIEP